MRKGGKGKMSLEALESGRPLRQHEQQEDNPSQAVATAVFQINTAVATFQRLVNTLGTPKDTLDLRDKLHRTRQDIAQLVKVASAKLKEASETDLHTQVSASKKITDVKLAKDFQSVLKEFQRAQSEEEVRSHKNHEHHALLLESSRQEMQLLENELAFNDAIIEDREQGIQEIQQQIGEVNEIFKDLAVLVHDQGILIDDISSNMESSHSATTQLPNL